MNYIVQMRSFWNWRRLNEISSKQADLYFAILDCGNSAHWKDNFNIPNATLQFMCGLSKSELYRSREALVQAGLITYKNGTKGIAGVYHIVPLTDYNPITLADVCADEQEEVSEKEEIGTKNDVDFGTDIATNTATNSDTNADTNAISPEKCTNFGTNIATNLTTNPGTIHKHKYKHKQNNYTTKEKQEKESGGGGVADETVKQICEKMQNCWNMPAPSTYNVELLCSYVEDRDSPMSPEMVLRAIEIAAENNKPNVAYAKGVLNNWRAKGFTTLTETEQERCRGADGGGLWFDVGEVATS